jgi:hypothetical protein
VATAFRKLLQSRRDGVPSKDVERALQALEEAALRTVNVFGAQLSNTLHIMAKTRYSPWGQSLVPKLEGRAEALAGTFNAQGVANTLWSYATMGRAPGAGVMRELEGRAEAVAGTFNVQGGANMLWAACVFSIFCARMERSMGSYGDAATGVPGQAWVLEYHRIEPVPSVSLPPSLPTSLPPSLFLSRTSSAKSEALYMAHGERGMSFGV